MLMAMVITAYAQKDTATARRDTLAEVVVYGASQEKDYQSAAPTFSLTQGNLDRLGVTDISSALNRMPGITLTDYGGAGGLKTVSVRGFGAKHTSIIYDGVALSNNQSGSIDVSRYSLDNVSELSLVVGDGDDIFQPARNAASAASLFINTMRVPSHDLSMHATVQLRAGSWDYVNPHFRLDKNISESFGMSLVGDFLHAGNDYPYTIDNVQQKVTDRRKNSRMNSGHGELSLVFRPDGHNTFSLKGYYYDNSRQLPGMVHYYVNDSREHMHDQNAFGQFNWNSTLCDKLKLACIAKFNYVMTDYKDPTYPHGVKDHQYWQREWYASASLLYTLNKNLSLDYAIDYAFNNLTGGDVQTYRRPRRNTLLQSVAAKYQNGRFTVVGRLLESLYYNQAVMGESAKNINHLSPSLSASYQLMENENLRLRLSYKDIFRSPSFNESYYDHYGSTDLDPECTHQINLGLTWSRNYGYGSHFGMTIDGYVNEVENKIVAIPYDMFKWTNVNLGSVNTRGIDATGSLSQTLAEDHRLIFSGNYTWQQVRDRTDGAESPYYNFQVAYTPEHSGSASLAWENPWLNVSANVIAVASRWPNNEHYPGTMLRSYQNVGLTLYRTLAIKHHYLHVRFDLKNLLDKQYEIIGHYPMPGRSWQVTLRYRI